jgi:hypothetical protein
MNRFVTKKISNDTNYKKTGRSYQDNLTAADIKKKLEDYKVINDINDVSLNSHIRYFIFDEKTGKKHFRLGGFLTKNEKDYIVLSNGQLSWSVQKKSATFFQKLTNQEIKQEVENKLLKKYEKTIIALNEENIKLKNTIKSIKKTVKK